MQFPHYPSEMYPRLITPTHHFSNTVGFSSFEWVPFHNLPSKRIEHENGLRANPNGAYGFGGEYLMTEEQGIEEFTPEIIAVNMDEMEYLPGLG